MNAYQISRLEPLQIETIVYSNPASTDLEIALSAKLLDLQQYSNDSDKLLETADERVDELEAMIESFLIVIEECKPKKAVKLIYKEAINV